jgi:hypothetical protein
MTNWMFDDDTSDWRYKVYAVSRGTAFGAVCLLMEKMPVTQKTINMRPKNANVLGDGAR